MVATQVTYGLFVFAFLCVLHLCIFYLCICVFVCSRICVFVFLLIRPAQLAELSHIPDARMQQIAQPCYEYNSMFLSMTM